MPQNISLEENNHLTGTVPITWRTATPAGLDDPRPLDSDFGVVFFTGQQEHTNTFNLFMRQISEALLTQIDIDGKKQVELDGHLQPDLGVSLYTGRPIRTLDGVSMSALDTKTMADLDKIDNPVFDSWITFSIKWGVLNQVILTNSQNPGYIMKMPSLVSEKFYFAVCSLRGNTARLIIYKLNNDMSINPNIIFDTTAINDSDLFKRRQGRIGWQTSLEDSNAYIYYIRPRNVTYAEFRSAPLETITPVAGAQLYSQFTPNVQLWNEFTPAPNNLTENSRISRDTSNSITGNSYRIDVYKGKNQGFQSNTMVFTNFSQAGISFSLFYPRVPAPGGLIAKLVGKNPESTIFLPLPIIHPNQWQNIRIPLTNSLHHTGEYRLIIEQVEEPPERHVATWWIDDVNVFQRAFQWSARSVVDDPWGSTYAPWTDFNETVNSETSGVEFTARGNQLQYRAKALRQDAIVAESPRIKPKYAELGRIVWPEEVKIATPPTASFTDVIGLNEYPTLTYIPLKPYVIKRVETDRVAAESELYWMSETLNAREEEVQTALWRGSKETLIYSTSEEPFIKSFTIGNGVIYFITNGGKYIGRIKRAVSLVNLIKKPSFEYGTIEGYEGSAAILSISNTQFFSGTHSLRLKGGEVGSPMSVEQSSASASSVTPETLYTFSVYIRAHEEETPHPCTPIIIWRNGSNEVIKEDVGPTVEDSNNKWTRISVSRTSPETAANAICAVEIGGSPKNGIHYVDAWQLTATPGPITYADGDISGYEWTGTHGNSTTKTVGVSEEGVEVNSTWKEIPIRHDSIAVNKEYIYIGSLESTKNKIMRLKTDGTELKESYIEENVTEAGKKYGKILDLKADENHIYWLQHFTEKEAPNGYSIKIYTTAGAHVTTYTTTEFLHGITLDSTHLYWSGKEGITRANLEAGEIEKEFIKTGTSYLSLAVLSGSIFWARNIGEEINTNYEIVEAKKFLNEYAVSFTSTSSAGSSHINTYEWSFGDGHTGTGSSIVHIYPPIVGIKYTVVLKVTDRNGLTSVATKEITV